MRWGLIGERKIDVPVADPPMDAQRAGTLREDIDLGERVDAFVARVGRLQDTLADKLLPEVLSWLGEAVGPAIDNVARAERLGWISDGQA